MKKQTPKAIAAVMLTVIAVLVLYIGTTEYPDTTTELQTTQNASGLEDLFVAETPEIEEEFSSDSYINTLYSVTLDLPKTASASDLYVYQQDIALEGEVQLQNAIYSTDCMYLIFEHASTSGDIMAAQPTVTVALITYDGTIQTLYNITTVGGSTYRASALTSSGIVVVTEDTAEDATSLTNVYIFSTDLSSYTCTPLASTTSCEIFVLSDSFLLFAARTDYSVYLFKNGVIANTGTISSGTIVDIYEFSNYFTIIINTINGYVVTTLSDTLTSIMVRTVTGKTALAVKPVTRDGVQYYLVAEFYDNQLRIAEYTTTFRDDDMRYIGIGVCDSANVLCNSSTIFALLETSDVYSLFIINESLQSQLSNSDIFSGTYELYDSVTYSGGYIILARQNETAISLIDIRDDGTSAINMLFTASSSALILRYSTQNAIVFYLSDSGISMTSIAI
ncbi:MAG: hypothetical protein R3Y23_03550 [Bacillota bacterium]